MTYKNYIKIVGICLCLLSTKVYSQQPYSLNYGVINDSTQTYFELNADGYLNSNGVSNELLHTSFNNKSFSNESLNTLLENSPENIIGGLDYRQNIKVAVRLKNSSITLLGGVSDRTHADFNITQQTYKLILQGNTAYQNQELQLNNTQLNYLRYQQLSFGGLYTSENKKFNIGAAANLINGNSYFFADFPNAQLFTAPFGEYLNINAQGLVYKTSTSKNTYFKQQGFGLGLDVFSQIKFNLFPNQDSSSLAILQLEVNDLGFIQWNGNSDLKQVDSSFTNISGINLNELINDSNYLFLSSDSAIYNVQNKKGIFVSYLPAFFSMSLSKSFQKHTFTIGITQRAAANFKSYVYAENVYTLTKSISILSRLSYGGYGKAGLGLGGRLNTKRFSIQLFTNHLEGWFLKKYSAGNQLGLILSTQF